jgi:hypothetical protein
MLGCSSTGTGGPGAGGTGGSGGAACLPDSNDDACLTCTKSACCTEYKALPADSHFGDWVDCNTACSDVACQDGCQAQYPTAAQKFQNIRDCQNTNCAAACGT